MTSRRATHAGSWYTSHGQELSRELDNWLQKAGPIENPARAIIGPHAGYRYVCIKFAQKFLKSLHFQKISHNF